MTTNLTPGKVMKKRKGDATTSGGSLPKSDGKQGNLKILIRCSSPTRTTMNKTGIVSTKRGVMATQSTTMLENVQDENLTPIVEDHIGCRKVLVSGKVTMMIITVDDSAFSPRMSALVDTHIFFGFSCSTGRPKPRVFHSDFDAVFHIPLSHRSDFPSTSLAEHSKGSLFADSSQTNIGNWQLSLYQRTHWLYHGVRRRDFEPKKSGNFQRKIRFCTGSSGKASLFPPICRLKEDGHNHETDCVQCIAKRLLQELRSRQSASSYPYCNIAAWIPYIGIQASP